LSVKLARVGSSGDVVAVWSTLSTVIGSTTLASGGTRLATSYLTAGSSVWTSPSLLAPFLTSLDVDRYASDYIGSLTCLQDGSVIAVWQSDRDPDSQGVYLGRLNIWSSVLASDGSTWSAPV